MVSPRWQYIVHEKRGEELYDWNKDPREHQDLARTPEGRDIVEQFRKKLGKAFARAMETNGARKSGD